MFWSVYCPFFLSSQFSLLTFVGEIFVCQYFKIFFATLVGNSKSPAFSSLSLSSSLSSHSIGSENQTWTLPSCNIPLFPTSPSYHTPSSHRISTASPGLYVLTEGLTCGRLSVCIPRLTH